MLDRLERLALRCNPPITQPSIGLAHAPKYTPPHSAKAATPPIVPVNFSAGRCGPYQPELCGWPYFPAQAVGFRPCRTHDTRPRRRGCRMAVAAEALVDAASAISPMWLICEDVRRKSRGSAPSTSVQFRVHSVVTRCALPLPLRAAFGALVPWKRHGGAWSFSPDSKLPCTPSQIDTRCTGCAAMSLDRRRSRSRKKAAGA